MSNATILPPKQDLIAAIVALLEGSGTDCSTALVVFPGKRPAHVLRKALADRLQTSYIPPRIETIDLFIEFLHNDVMGKRMPTLEIPDALSILFDIHSAEENKIGGEHYTTLDAFIPIGLKLIAELEEVAMAMLTKRQIQDTMVSVPFTSFHALSAYYEQFYSHVEQRGFVTRSMMYRAVASQIEHLEIKGFTQVILAGFYALTSAEQRIFASLQTREQVHLIFQQGTGLRQQLEKISIVPEQTEVSPVQLPEIHCISAPDLHGQVYALAAQLREHQKQQESLSHRTAIALPSSDALFPLYHSVLSLIPADEYNIALGYPVTRTPAFGFLESLMKLAESEAEGTYSSMEYIKFLLHPYVKNIRLGTRSDITRIIMHTIEEYLAECGIVHVSLESLEQDDALLASIHKRTARVDETITREHIREHIEEIHLNTLKKFKTFPTIGECARSAREIFLYIFTRSTAYLHPYFRPYVERLTDALDSVASSLLAEQRFTEQAGYFSFLRHFLATESVPFSGTPLKGVQVLGLLETRNLSFDTLYMLDVNDDIVPGKPEADLLLPQQVRARLGLETYRDREKLVEYYFNLAVANANTVYFFYTSSASGKQEKSRFVEKLLWQMQQRDCTISAEPYERIAKYRVHLANAHPQEIPKTGEMVRWMKQQLQLSATALDTYTTCQIKFYYRHVFHLDVKDEVSDANDASVVGKIVHKALFEYFEPYTGKTLAKEMLTQERLQEVVDSCFTNQFGANATGMNMLFKEQVAEHLWKFLERYQIPLVEREQITIMALERSLQVEKWGVTLKGTIDRIEMRGTHVHILDYKTTSDEKALCIRLDRLIPDDSSTWQDAIQSFQLPMYMLLYNEMTDRGTEHITPAYLFLGRTTIDGEIEGGIGNEHESAGTVYRAIEKVIFNMIQEILDPNHAFLPASHIEKQCPACPYHVMCGTQWTGVHRKF